MINKIFVILLLLWTSTGCSEQEENTNTNINNSNDSNNSSKISEYSVEIIDEFEHSTDYYTQGFVIHNDNLYEGTGQTGASKLIKYNLKNLTEEKNISINNNYFGEGVTILNDKIYQLTWLNQIALVYDLKTMKLEKEFSYSGQGWGITNDDSLLYMSDGSATIRVINPKDFTAISNIRITKNNQPVQNLNELELIDTLLYANIYMQDWIIIANIKTGEVVGEIDISSLWNELHNNPEAEVPNGIAYDKSSQTFYLTGKYWNKIFQVKFVKK